ncbi:protein shisa-5 [Protobothrops mucrosquamatus]|uniref:protein shisa-5 n=1 Tax=Protobothrops mucrosquamatus TaxID=103944 RepID=UPI000775DEEB|nr:protein shisa-5 [Protobothrops mucrosquamatus]
MAFARSPLWSLCVLLGFLVPPGGSSEHCEAYTDSDGFWHPQQTCSEYCCGTCTHRYCCSDRFKKNDQFICSMKSTFPSFKPEPFKMDPDFEDLYSSDFSGTFIAIGISIFVVFVVAIILCFTCSCCCLYKACRRRPQPIVTTSTTVMQVPYPQQPGVPVAYAAGAYQGYNPLPVQPQPGMPAAPYPTQYPPPYPTQPIRPPPYQETVAAGASAPSAQPPYNPAYMDPPKASY